MALKPVNQQDNPGLAKLPTDVRNKMGYMKGGGGVHRMPDGTMMKDSEHKGMKKGGWIKDAIKKPGALRKSLGVKKGQKIPAGKLAAAAKKPGKMGQRARLAQTLKGLKK